MNASTLDQVWTTSGNEKQLQVRFNDWNHQIKYFTIHGESTDGKRLVGVLDSGEKISFSKESRGWSLYYHEAEFTAKAV